MGSAVGEVEDDVELFDERVDFGAGVEGEVSLFIYSSYGLELIKIIARTPLGWRR